jgi:hypothetical protein
MVTCRHNLVVVLCGALLQCKSMEYCAQASRFERSCCSLVSHLQATSTSQLPGIQAFAPAGGPADVQFPYGHPAAGVVGCASTMLDLPFDPCGGWLSDTDCTDFPIEASDVALQAGSLVLHPLPNVKLRLCMLALEAQLADITTRVLKLLK